MSGSRVPEPLPMFAWRCLFESSKQISQRPGPFLPVELLETGRNYPWVLRKGGHSWGGHGKPGQTSATNEVPPASSYQSYSKSHVFQTCLEQRPLVTITPAMTTCVWCWTPEARYPLRHTVMRGFCQHLAVVVLRIRGRTDALGCSPRTWHLTGPHLQMYTYVCMYVSISLSI